MSSPSAVRRVPLLDLSLQHAPLREEILAELTRVVDSQRFIGGPDIAELEASIAAYCGTKYAIGCASGSDALFLALLALGVGPGDQVLTAPYTFFATVGAIVRAGAEPVYVDIDPATYNLDLNQVSTSFRQNSRIKAIIPIHLYGGCADMGTMLDVAGDTPVIEDAAQAIGAEYRGKRAGSMGAIGCFSFFPSKNLGAMGDAGMLTTNDAALAGKLAALRVHGSKQRYYHQWVGVNSRLDSMQAAVLRVKFRHLDSWTAARQNNAAQYARLLKDVPVQVPHPASYQTRHVYNQFVVAGEQRDALRAHLDGLGIGTEVYYPLPLHLQPCFAYLGGKPGDYPVSERAAATTLALPIQPELTPDAIEYVADGIRAFYKS